MYCKTLGSGKPVLYLHGWGCDGSIFLPVARLLPQCANYLLDLPGFGSSAPPPVSGWDVSDYCEQVRYFLQERQLAPVTVVAHSFGCRVAIMLSAKYPHLTERMLLVAPAGLRRPSLRRWLKVRCYKLRKLFGRNTACGSDDYRNCPPALRNTFVKVVNTDLSRYARRVRCDVVIVNGDKDEATPLAHAKRLKSLMERGHLTVIDGDHFAFFRTPHAFAAAIESLLE